MHNNVRFKFIAHPVIIEEVGAEGDDPFYKPFVTDTPISPSNSSSSHTREPLARFEYLRVYLPPQFD